jgi:hypothetical protein
VTARQLFFKLAIFWHKLAAVLLVTVATATTCGEQAFSRIPIFTERFGDPTQELILISGMVGEKPVKMVFDTGSEYTVIDRSLSEELDAKEFLDGLEIYSGLALQLCDTTKLKVGNLIGKQPLRVAVADLSPFRARINANIFAVLGFDVIKEYRWQLDFSSKTIEAFAAELPGVHAEANAVRIALHPSAGKKDVSVAAAILDKKSLFVLDTGQSRVSLTRGEFERLSKTEALDLKGTGTYTTIGALSETREEGRLEMFKLGPIQVGNLPVFSGSENRIGLNLLQHFMVTFDFPNGEMYLSLPAK